MKISEFKAHLDNLSSVVFVQPDGNKVPEHFHITEAGLVTKHFIDCGGTIRTEKNISFQLWVATDYDHRLEAGKLKKIIAIAEPLFGADDCEVEVEYQTESISRFGLHFDGAYFVLVPKRTDCLAKDLCGVLPTQKTKVTLATLQTATTGCCTPGSGCC